jgi:hypothetical protein
MRNALLARYFSDKGLLAQLDFASMPEGKPDALFEAWLGLTDAQRQAAEADFREIHAMSDRKGLTAIVDEARWHLDDRPAQTYTAVSLGSRPVGHGLSPCPASSRCDCCRCHLSMCCLLQGRPVSELPASKQAVSLGLQAIQLQRRPLYHPL